MNEKIFSDLVLMVDLFCASIETGVYPQPGSECHKMAREFVEASGQVPERERLPLSGHSDYWKKYNKIC